MSIVAPSPRRFSAMNAATMLTSMLSLVVLILTGFTLVAQPAAAVDNGSLGIRPSNESDFFHLSVLPGETISAVAIVSNHTATDAVLDTYAVDGLTTSTGAFALKSQNEPRVQVGSWTHDPAAQITVAPKSQLKLPFTITVPVGTAPGDYAGALIIQSQPEKGATTNSGGTPVRIDVVQRQGVRIYLTVAGKEEISLDPGALDWAQHANSMTVTLPIKNTGNVTLHPTVTAEVDAWFAGPRTITFTAPESVPPGTTVTLTASYPMTPFLQVASVTATVKSAASTANVATTVIDIPWQIFAGLALFLLIASFCSWRFGRFLRTARSAIANQNAAPLGPDGTTDSMGNQQPTRGPMDLGGDAVRPLSKP